MKTLSDISLILKERKPQLFDRYGIEFMAIFGSYSRHDQKNDSDLDLLVEFNKPIGIEFLELADELEKMLEIKVDLISKNGLKPKYYEAIESELIYV
jgi:uncharacterized protein